MPDTDAPDTESLADAPLQRSLLVGSPRLSPARVRRLAELGIRAGCTVVALSRTPGRGRVIAVAGSRIALAGAPNAGKSTLFNAITGARRSVGNYPGTTVEVGRAAGQVGELTVALVDLPGAYSLDPLSPDEELTRELLVGVPRGEGPAVVLVVVDAAHLARSLYLVAQLRETTHRVVGRRHRRRAGRRRCPLRVDRRGGDGKRPEHGCRAPRGRTASTGGSPLR